MKTSELTGPALDWAVFLADKPSTAELFTAIHRTPPPYSTDWAQAGPIIERELIDLRHIRSSTTYWEAWTPAPEHPDGEVSACGPTPLIAAMRCYVASKLGEEVEIPEELK